MNRYQRITLASSGRLHGARVVPCRHPGVLEGESLVYSPDEPAADCSIPILPKKNAPAGLLVQVNQCTVSIDSQYHHPHNVWALC